jgi:uncharacterized SAM-binding protein YcdF (DUF218 family)
LDLWLAVPADLQPADAIVVLGSGGATGGVLSNASAVGVRKGVALFQKGLAPLLVFSGGPEDGDTPEAAVRAEIARARGIPAGAILIETKARTTNEEALRQKDLLQSRGVRTILLVANSVHLRRASPLFERSGFTVHAVPSDTYTDPEIPESRLDLMRSVLKDLSGVLYYLTAGFY